MAKIVLENKHGRYEIEVKNDPVDLSDYYHDLIQPVLSAAGFSGVDEFFGVVDDNETN